MTSLPSELNIFATESARRNLVIAYKKSGLSQKSFCAQHGVNASTFKNWYYRTPECSHSDVIEDSVPCFVQTLDPSFLFKSITVQEDAEALDVSTVSPPIPKPASVPAEPTCLHPTSSAPTIHIDCSAFRIAVPIGFDAATLQGILSIMQAVS